MEVCVFYKVGKKKLYNELLILRIVSFLATFTGLIGENIQRLNEQDWMVVIVLLW